MGMEADLQVLILENKLEVIQWLSVERAGRRGGKRRVARIKEDVAIAGPSDPKCERTGLVVELEIRRFFESRLVERPREILWRERKLLLVCIRDRNVQSTKQVSADQIYLRKRRTVVLSRT